MTDLLTHVVDSIINKSSYTAPILVDISCYGFDYAFLSLKFEYEC